MLKQGTRTLRTVEVFREVNSDFAVPKDYAQSVTETALGALGTVLGGRVEAVGFRGLAIRSQDRTLDVSKLRLPPGVKHGLVLTGRDLIRNERPIHGVTANNKRGSVIESTNIIAAVEGPVADPYGATTIETIAHEGAHSFGVLGHCALSSCVMHAYSARRPDDFSADRAQQPFCDDCSVDLELAGHMALAQVL
jgi:hypothetical protein